MDIKYARNIEEARAWLKNGYEPVECSFGPMSVVGRWELDHHNEFSDNPPVSWRAFLLAASGVNIQYFVVTGMPDMDILYAISALSGKIPLIRDEAKAILEADSSSVAATEKNLRPFLNRYRRILVLRRKILPLPFSESGFKRGIKKAVRILNGGYTEEDERRAIREEMERPEKARKAILATSKNGIFVKFNDWGEDVWFKDGARWVVRYDPLHKVVVVSSKDDLQDIYPVLGAGWGGHNNIGGSPRGQKMTLKDAEKVYAKIKSLI